MSSKKGPAPPPPASMAGALRKSQELEQHRNALRSACAEGDVNAVRKLVHEQPTLANEADEQGGTPLHTATNRCRADVIKCLAEMGARMDAEDSAGFQAVHLAAMHGRRSILRTLFHSGAQVGVKSADGETPLHLAVKGGHLRCTKWLIRHGASVDEEDFVGRTPLGLAEDYGRKEMVKLLKESKTARAGKAKDGSTIVVSSDDSDDPEQAVAAGAADEPAFQRKSRRQSQLEADKQKVYATLKKKEEETDMTFLEVARQDVEGTG